MADLPTVTPNYFEILVVRELRKVGFEVGAVRIHRRAELPEPERGFVLELLALLSRPPWTRQVLIACRRQEAPIAREVVDSLKARLKDAAAARRPSCALAHSPACTDVSAVGPSKRLTRITGRPPRLAATKWRIAIVPSAGAYLRRSCAPPASPPESREIDGRARSV